MKHHSFGLVTQPRLNIRPCCPVNKHTLATNIGSHELSTGGPFGYRKPANNRSQIPDRFLMSMTLFITAELMGCGEHVR